MILLGAMIAGGVSLWIKIRKESQNSYSFETRFQSELAEKDDEI
jgi:hypothetical protein